MSNNDVLKKLRVALHLRNDEILDILKLVNFEISPSELNAFFRNDSHPKFRKAGDQVLRKFLDGLIIKMRGLRADEQEAASTLNLSLEDLSE
jgi:uncharacterized protein YehS (DUF1456 family)